MKNVKTTVSGLMAFTIAISNVSVLKASAVSDNWFDMASEQITGRYENVLIFDDEEGLCAVDDEDETYILYLLNNAVGEDEFVKIMKGRPTGANISIIPVSDECIGKITDIIGENFDLEDTETFFYQVSPELCWLTENCDKAGEFITEEKASKICEKLREEGLISDFVYTSLGVSVSELRSFNLTYPVENKEVLEKYIADNGLEYTVFDFGFNEMCTLVPNDYIKENEDVKLNNELYNILNSEDNFRTAQQIFKDLELKTYWTELLSGDIVIDNVIDMMTDIVKKMLGDIDGNEVVDLSDLTDLSLYLLDDKKLSEEQAAAADFDENGKVEIADLAFLKQYVLDPSIKLGR